ncbi:MAG TPA: BatA and WFA domain-containing protein [bacterium]|nr:BatA and WFA domain-containing protein [bacterium]
MTLGSPASLWGLLAIPLLVALYLLRVRRREHLVSSILLWQRSASTRTGSRPWYRVERSLLLVLQILAVAAIVAGLARPAVVGRAPAGDDLFLVLDASLSMRARDVVPTRFHRARAEALEVVARLRAGQRAGVVLAGPRPLVLVPLTGDRSRLRAALGAAEPWDTVGDVAGAVSLAAAQQPGPRGRIVVWTDAAQGGLPALSRVAYRLLGTSDDNVGITRFRVLRDPGGTEAVVRVQNFGSRAWDIPLEVSRDGTPIYRTALALAAGESRTVVFPVSGAGVLRARLQIRDALPEDDQAVAVLDPTPLPPVLLVSPGNPYIEKVLALLPVARAAETRTADPSTWAGFGVVILDRVATGPLPPGNYLLIGTVPPNLPMSASGVVPRPGIATWDRTDPVLRYVTLDDVRVDRALALAPEEGRVLAEGRVPLLWAYEGRGVRALLLGFALEDSDLPLHVAFPVLMANSLAWLGGGTAEAGAGEILQVPAAGAEEAVVTTPEGRRQRVHAVDGAFVLPPFIRAGLYHLASPAGDRQFAVGTGSARAGMIRPGEVPGAQVVATEIPATRIPAAQVSPASGSAGSVPDALLTRISLWPWLLVAAIAAAVGEWALATHRRGAEA